MFWMTVISLLLFWLPLLGPAIAGFVGGRKAGGVGPAVIAALLPGFLFGAILFVLASVLTGFPLLGAIAVQDRVTVEYAIRARAESQTKERP